MWYKQGTPQQKTQRGVCWLSEEADTSQWAQQKLTRNVSGGPGEFFQP